jgi:hypothetical protein
LILDPSKIATMDKYANGTAENSQQGTLVKKPIVETYRNKKDIFVYKLN